jgi:hypothetical protein
MFGAVRRSRDERCTHLRYKVRNGRNMGGIGGTRLPAIATFWGPEGPDALWFTREMGKDTQILLIRSG